MHLCSQLRDILLKEYATGSTRKKRVESRAIHVQASDVHMSGTSNRCGNIEGCAVFLPREAHQKLSIQPAYWCWPHGYPLASNYQNSRLSEDSRCSLYVIWPVQCSNQKPARANLASTPSVNGNLKLSIAYGKSTRMNQCSRKQKSSHLNSSIHG